MKAWIGKTLVVIGVAHSIVGLITFHPVLVSMLREGLVNTMALGQDPEREAAFWYFYSGFALMIVGGLVDRIERSEARLPRFLGWTFAVLTVLGLVVIPVSGFWLLIVPTVAMLRRGSRKK